MPLQLESDPTLDAAMQRLDGLEAAESAPVAPLDGQAAPEPQQPAEQVEPGTTEPDPLATDTPAEADPKPSTEPKDKSSEKPKPGDKPPVEDPNKSKFAKDAQRRDTSWKALNAEKQALQTERAAFELRRQQLDRQQEQFTLKQAKSQSRITPEQYEQTGVAKISSAQNLDLVADGLERRAEKLEADGKYGEAENCKAQARAKREEAAGDRALARMYKGMAETARKAPADPTLEQIRQRNAQHKQHYTLEAAKQWPELAKEGSAFQKTMAGHLRAASEQGIDPDEHPIIMYHAARLTAAETAAASVPGLTKKLGELQAKVKELELLTAPGGGQPAAAKLGERQPSDEDDAIALRQEALQRS